MASDRTYKIHQAIAFKLRGLLMVPPILLLFFWHEWEWEYEPGLWTAGLLFFVPGVALRVWSQRHLRYRLREGHALATAGPYSCMRNPVYVGNMLLLAGLCVLCELPWAIPLVCGWAFFVYDCAVRFEEGRLLKRHGEEYAQYCRAVRRWRPRVSAQEDLTIGHLATWARAAGAEWQCLLLPIIPIIKEFVY